MTRLYLRSSVAAGHPWARGDGLEKRMLQAAEGGDARAQCNLGILYGNGLDDNGHAVEANRPQAARWLLAAAEQGLALAQVKLAEAYAEEADISGSDVTACGWFLLGCILNRSTTLTKRILMSGNSSRSNTVAASASWVGMSPAEAITTSGSTH